MKSSASYTDATLRRTVEVYAAAGNQQQAAARLGVVQSVVSERLKEASKRGIFAEGSIDGMQARKASRPKAGCVKRYILTCAQNWTKLHEPTWRNLQALALHYEAQLLVSTFSYDKDALGQNKLAKRRLREFESAAEFPPEIATYTNNERINLTDSLTWCGELQISPTARRPLSGFETYTYRRSSIIPHTTVAMRSVAAVKGEGVKLLYTTGCVTQRNYIQRREGFRAEHFHTYGALLVEVDSSGSWFCRQLTQGDDGAMHDLDIRVMHGKIESQRERGKAAGGRGMPFVADIMWGDIHASKVDKAVASASWGANPDSMIETLRPASQHAHDILDFTPRSHWTRRDPHEMYRAHVKSRGNVITELKTTASVTNDIWRPWCETYVVNANHDRFLQRYLQEIDWRNDLENAKVILSLNLEILDAIDRDDDNRAFYLPEVALRQVGLRDEIHFLREDQSHILLPDLDGGIEAGVHGDRGPNGSKGTVAGMAKMSRRINMADKHFAEICDGVYCGGTSAALDMGYNKGPSSWTHSHIVTYRNGTRAIIGIRKGKWRATA